MNDDAASNPYAAPETLGRPIEPGPDDGPTGPGGAYRVAYRNTEEDIAALLLQVRRTSRIGRYAAALGPFLGAAVMLGVASRMPAGPPRSVTIGTALITALLLWALSRSAARRGMRKLARSFKERPAQTVEIGPAGLAVRLEDGSGETRPWGMVSKVVADDAVLMLYTAERGNGRSVMAHVVPRRAFATPEAAEAFLRAASRWWREARAAGGGDPAPAPIAAEAGGGGPGVTYELTEAERRVARRANRSMFRHLWRAAAFRSLFAAALMALGVVGLRPATRGLLTDGMEWMAWAWLGLGALLGLAAMRVWWIILVGIRPDPKDRGPIALAIAPTGLAIRRPGGREGLYAWSRIQAVAGDARFLKLVLESGIKRQIDGGTILVPRRAFPTTAAADEFLESARRWHAAARGRAASS